MMEITGVGMGLMMTAVAVAIAGLMVEATLLLMCRALQPPALVESLEPDAIHVT